MNRIDRGNLPVVQIARNEQRIGLICIQRRQKRLPHKMPLVIH